MAVSNHTIPSRAHVTLYVNATDGKSLQEEMVAEGLARVVEPRGVQSPEVKALLGKLLEAQERARKQHVGIWRFGDVGSDDESEIAPRRRR